MNATPRLRIAVLNRQFGARFGGAERYSVAVAEQLAQRHEVHVFAQILEDLPPGVQGHRIAGPLAKPRWLNQLWFALASGWRTRRGFDVVHSHENTCHGQVQTVHVKPVVHNLLGERRGWSRAWVMLQMMMSPRLLAYVLLEHCRLSRRRHRVIVAASQALAQVLPRHFDLLPGQLQVLPPGVRIPPMATEVVHRERRARARQGLSLPPSSTLLLMIGHDYRKKGLGALLQALPQLPHEVHLVVVGQESQIPSWRPMVDQAGLSDRVHFLGVLPDTRPAYEACDIMVHATLEDTFGMVTLEAMAHQLPLIVSRAPYCLSSSQLEDGQQALILQDPTSGAEIAFAVQRIREDLGLSSTLKRQGLAYVQHYAWPTLARQQEALYHLALKGVS